MIAAIFSIILAPAAILSVPFFRKKSIFRELRTLYFTEFAILCFFLVPLLWIPHGGLGLSIFLAVYCSIEIFKISGASIGKRLIMIAPALGIYYLMLSATGPLLFILLGLIYCFLIIPLKQESKVNSRLNPALYFYPAILAPFMVRLSGFENGALIIIFTYLCTECFDSFALIIGKLLGRKRVFPILSPNKTLEGLLGGTLAACLASSLFAHFNHWHIFQAILIALLFSITTIFGDLVASSIKRQFRVKDFGNVLPLQGGVLDIYDSILFNLPLMYIILFFNERIFF